MFWRKESSFRASVPGIKSQDTIGWISVRLGYELGRFNSLHVVASRRSLGMGSSFFLFTRNEKITKFNLFVSFCFA